MQNNNTSFKKDVVPDSFDSSTQPFNPYTTSHLTSPPIHSSTLPSLNSSSPYSQESSSYSPLASNFMGDLQITISRRPEVNSFIEGSSEGMSSREEIRSRNSSSWESSSSIQENRYQDTLTINYGINLSGENRSIGSSRDQVSIEDSRQQFIGNTSLETRVYDLESLTSNLPLPINTQSESFSFDPWSLPSNSSSIPSTSLTTSNSYSTSVSPPSKSISNPRSNSITLPQPISQQEDIWSRTNKEEEFASKQRQQRDQLQLQTQQQDQWYRQEAYLQRQQQEIQRSQQRLDGLNRLNVNNSNGNRLNTSNAYEIPTSPPTLLSNSSNHNNHNNSTSYNNNNFSNPSPPVTSFRSTSLHRNSPPTPYLQDNSSYRSTSSSSIDNSSPYLINRESSIHTNQFSPQSSIQSSHSPNYTGGVISNQVGVSGNWSPLPTQEEYRVVLPKQYYQAPNRSNQLPPSSSSLPSPNPSWTNPSDQAYPNYLLPQNRLNNQPLLPSSSSSSFNLLNNSFQQQQQQQQLPINNLNRSSPLLNNHPNSNFNSNSYSTSTSTDNILPIPSPSPRTNNLQYQQQQQRQQQTSTTLPKVRSPIVETLRSGLPVVPDRSAFAMWTGNVPGDTTLEELEKFFNSRPGPGYSPTSSRPPSPNSIALLNSNGVESIHLISRSNCAFINYLTAAHLHYAISITNGQPLRPLDKRCKPLLCRVRMREDDAKSGVGAQRGGGLHKGYIASLLAGGVEKEKVNSQEVEEKELEEEDENEDDESNGSTSSSSLMRYFPKRFFILKSHNNEDLEKSVETGVWSTQSHNESVLDQAYRTAKDGVYFVFSANKSGEWFGYAKMAGPIGTSSSSTTEWSTSTSTLSLPQSISGKTSVEPDNHSKLSPETLISSTGNDGDTKEIVEEGSEFAGKPFKVEWIKVQKMPFIRTRHILNSFNSSREVKISRDGTEIEPIAGDQLLRQFWFEPKRLAGSSPNPTSRRTSKTFSSGLYSNSASSSIDFGHRRTSSSSGQR